MHILVALTLRLSTLTPLSQPGPAVSRLKIQQEGFSRAAQIAIVAPFPYLIEGQKAFASCVVFRKGPDAGIEAPLAQLAEGRHIKHRVSSILYLVLQLRISNRRQTNFEDHLLNTENAHDSVLPDSRSSSTQTRNKHGVGPPSSSVTSPTAYSLFSSLEGVH